MGELIFAAEEVVTSASVSSSIDKIAARRTIVYETLIDPAVVRIAAEKNKNKLFSRFLFKLNRPEEIEFVSIEKYYEPYIVVSGKYLIDYYRKCAYRIKVDGEVQEVILLNQTFAPDVSERSIKLEGEERLVKELRAFLILDKFGQDSKLKNFPSAPSEKNPDELIESFKMQEVDSNVDIEVIRKKIEQRPNDINRIVNEVFEIEERSLIYTPRFKVTYKCPKIGKEAFLEFDGVTSKLIRQNENAFSAVLNVAASKAKRLFFTVEKLIKPPACPP